MLASPAAAQNARLARCAADGAAVTLSNAALAVGFDITDGHLRPARLVNRLSGGDSQLQGELFELKLRDGAILRASDFHVDAPIHCLVVPGSRWSGARIRPKPHAGYGGVLAQNDGGLTIAWRASMSAEGPYLRESFLLKTAKDVDIASVSLISLYLPGASIAGTADGAPIVSGGAFFAFEHPMARALVINGEATSTLKRALPLLTGIPITYTAVIGVAAPGQMRRSFAAYLEAERAHPFRTFLHYNSWYDIGYFSRYTEADALGAIEHIGKELVVKRHVVVDSFLFDDGWDDTARLWEFNNGFPQGFSRIRAAAEKFGAEPGVWLSPWGGYGPPRQARLAAAKAAGYEVDTQGLALSGPKYYARFHAAAVGLLQTYGINQFKLDGTGSPDKVTPGSAFDSDFAAAMALIQDLRVVRPDLFINLTTGTWPSPFWLMTRRFDLARRRGSRIRRTGYRPAALDHLSRRRCLRRHRAPEPFLSLERAHAARDHFRPPCARIEQRSRRRSARRSVVVFRERHRPSRTVCVARPFDPDRIGTSSPAPRAGRASARRYSRTAIGRAGTRRVIRFMVGRRGALNAQ